MDSVEYTFRFREKYLADQLKPEDKRAFEEELTRNPELLEALKEQIYLGNMLGEFLEEEKADSSLETEIPPKEIRDTEILPDKQVAVLQRMFARPATIAAAIAFLLICAWGLWWITNQPNKFQLIASKEFQHFSNKEVDGLDQVLGTPDPNDTTNKVAVDPLKFAAFEAYVIDDYESAYDKLSSFIETEKDSSGGALFYRGICAMETERYPQAQEDFKNYLGNYLRGDYREDAMWYKSLAQLQEGQLSEAKRQLEELAETGVRYKGRARELLREVEE